MDFNDVFRAVMFSAHSDDPTHYVEARQAYLDQADDGDDLAGLFSSVSPAEAARQFGEQLDAGGDANLALACCDVAVMLEPDEMAHRKTRGIVRMSALQPEGAAADFAPLQAAGDPFALLLRDYLQVIYPPCFFAPVRFPDADAPGHDDDASFVRDAGQVRWLMQVYATRLQTVRGHLIDKGAPADAPWLPNGLEAVLPTGPVTLQRWTVEHDGDEIEANEHLPDEIDELGGLNLLGLLRGEWAAMTLLAWLSGLETLALPVELKPRPSVRTALGWSEFFLWRARDQQLSEGEGARQGGLPGFEWRGLDLADVSPILAAVAGEEAAEIQAMVKWLTREALQSPFQDGLRDS